MIKRKPREEMTREMLQQHIEALTTTPDTMQAALECKVSYPTFLARFRRLGLKVTDVREQVLEKNVMPEIIVAQVFNKREKVKKSNVLKFKSLKQLAMLLEKAAHQLQDAANAA